MAVRKLAIVVLALGSFVVSCGYPPVTPEMLCRALVQTVIQRGIRTRPIRAAATTACIAATQTNCSQADLDNYAVQLRCQRNSSGGNCASGVSQTCANALTTAIQGSTSTPPGATVSGPPAGYVCGVLRGIQTTATGLTAAQIAQINTLFQACAAALQSNCSSAELTNINGFFASTTGVTAAASLNISQACMAALDPYIGTAKP